MESAPFDEMIVLKLFAQMMHGDNPHVVEQARLALARHIEKAGAHATDLRLVLPNRSNAQTFIKFHEYKVRKAEEEAEKAKAEAMELRAEVDELRAYKTAAEAVPLDDVKVPASGELVPFDEVKALQIFAMIFSPNDHESRIAVKKLARMIERAGAHPSHLELWIPNREDTLGFLEYHKLRTEKAEKEAEKAKGSEQAALAQLKELEAKLARLKAKAKATTTTKATAEPAAPSTSAPSGYWSHPVGKDGFVQWWQAKVWKAHQEPARSTSTIKAKTTTRAKKATTKPVGKASKTGSPKVAASVRKPVKGAGNCRSGMGW
jgi:hypothetical protein